jgi:hypothetical protein
MANTITWLIEQMSVKPQEDGETDVVMSANWRCNGTDGTYFASQYGACGFTLQQGGQFTPYSQLTQQQVLDWCYANGVDKQSVEDGVAGALKDMATPPVVTPPLPWSQAVPA